MKHLPRHLRITKAERRRKREQLKRSPQMVGLDGIQWWGYRVITLKRRRRWAKRGEQRHERHLGATTGTIGGRSRAYDVLTFNEDAPRIIEQIELDRLFWRDSFLITLPSDAIIMPKPLILMYDPIFADLDAMDDHAS